MVNDRRFGAMVLHSISLATLLPALDELSSELSLAHRQSRKPEVQARLEQLDHLSGHCFDELLNHTRQAFAGEFHSLESLESQDYCGWLKTCRKKLTTLLGPSFDSSRPESKTDIRYSAQVDCLRVREHFSHSVAGGQGLKQIRRAQFVRLCGYLYLTIIRTKVLADQGVAIPQLPAELDSRFWAGYKLDSAELLSLLRPAFRYYAPAETWG